MYAQDSIDLLQNSGLQFREHEEHGIEPLEFAELLMSSGEGILQEFDSYSTTFKLNQYKLFLLGMNNNVGSDYLTWYNNVIMMCSYKIMWQSTLFIGLFLKLNALTWWLYWIETIHHTKKPNQFLM